MLHPDLEQAILNLPCHIYRKDSRCDKSLKICLIYSNWDKNVTSIISKSHLTANQRFKEDTKYVVFFVVVFLSTIIMYDI